MSMSGEAVAPSPQILLANKSGTEVGSIPVTASQPSQPTENPVAPTPIEGATESPQQQAAEQAQAPEIIPPTDSRRKEETNEVFHAAMMKSAVAAEIKLKDKKLLNSSEMRAINYKRVWLITNKAKDTNYAEESAQKGTNDGGLVPDFPIFIGLDPKTGEQIPTNGAGHKIEVITARKVVNGQIIFEYLAGGTMKRQVSAEILMQASILGGRDEIVKSMQSESTALGAVATSRIDSISDPNTNPPSDLEIQQASATAGVINTEQAIKYAKNSGVTEESLTRIQDALAGKNVLTAEDVSMLLYSTTNVESQLRAAEADVSRMQKEILAAQASLDSLNSDTDGQLIMHYKKQIADLQGSLKTAQQNKEKFEAIRAEMPASEGDYVTLVQNLYAKGHGAELVTAMNSEDPTKTLEVLLEKSFDPTTPDGSEIQKKFDKAKLIGGAAGFMVLLMLLNSMKE